jgi:hypothetical protein
MSRVINPETDGKERDRWTREILLAGRELMTKGQVDDQTRDLDAYIAIALVNIFQTIDVSVAAWEKRGYWIKADRYRMEWMWTERLGLSMKTAVLAEDWPAVAALSGQVMQKLSHVRLPKRPKTETPWTGAYQQLRLKQS